MIERILITEGAIEAWMREKYPHLDFVCSILDEAGRPKEFIYIAISSNYSGWRHAIRTGPYKSDELVKESDLDELINGLRDWAKFYAESITDEKAFESLVSGPMGKQFSVEELRDRISMLNKWANTSERKQWLGVAKDS